MINKHIHRLWAGQADGHYDLPASVLALRTVAEALPLPTVPEPRVANVEDLAEDAAEAVIAGADIPTDVGEMVIASREAHDAWSVESRFRQELSRRLEVKITDAVNAAEDEVITGLRPSLTKLAADLEKVAKVLPRDVSAGIILAADNAKMRAAWQALTDLAVRYVALRGAWSAFRQQPQWDERGEFAEFENLAELWPGAVRTVAVSMAPNTPPWPSDPPERLLWLAHNAARFILPTVAERDRLWWAKYGAGVERQRASAAAMTGFRGIGGDRQVERGTRHPREVIAGTPRPTGTDAA